MNTIGKFIITFALLFGFHVNSFAQNENDSPPPPPPMLIAEQMPSYKGGEDAMSSFIRENVKYPKKAKKKGITGTCYITFVVEADGSLSNIKVSRGIEKGQMLDDEALRVIKKMPKWIPGKQDGEPIRVYFNLPIKFTLK